MNHNETFGSSLNSLHNVESLSKLEASNPNFTIKPSDDFKQVKVDDNHFSDDSSSSSNSSSGSHVGLFKKPKEISGNISSFSNTATGSISKVRFF